MSLFYMLRCESCKETFPSVVSTDEDELIVPDFEQMTDQAGLRNAERFEDFFHEHRYHHLRAVEA